MKLVLDFNRPKLPKLFWFVLALACSIMIARQMPVSWISGSFASKTGCRVILQQPAGTIWQGSAAFAFSEPNASVGGCRDPMSVTERFHWSTGCNLFSLSCNAEIKFAALEQAQLIHWNMKKTQIVANEIKLPANILEGLGNPWSTLRPRGELGARWTDINLIHFDGGFGGGLLVNSGSSDTANNLSSGVIRIIMRNLTSPISPVKPLGGYEILANIAAGEMGWSLSTTSGPLLLKGQGKFGTKGGDKGMHFSGEANASPESQESLIGLLSLLGKKEGDTYRLEF